VADFLNPYFAEPAASGVPGEAEDWTWSSVSGAVAWAEFNTAAFVAAYQRAREDFEAGFSLAWDKSYANEAARLSDATLTPADIGVIARQEDTDTLYVLEHDSPPIWQEVPSTNHEWVDALIAGIVIAGVFNGASSTFEATLETFSVWGELTWLVPGRPWVEVPTLVRQDSSGGLTPPFDLGFRGWYGTALLSNDWLLGQESFEEGWENSPFDAAAVQWHPGTAPGGILRSTALTFPITIPSGKTKFFVWHPTLDAFYRITLPSGVYATAADLAAELETQWTAAVAPIATGLEWGTWSESDGTEGITFGHSGAVFNEAAMFGVHVDEIEEDVRGLIGLHGLGPGGTGPSYVVCQADYASDYPVDVDGEDRILLDRWSYLDFIVEWDATLLFHVVEYGQVGAVFNAFSTGPDTKLETYLLADWFGAGAVWKTTPTPSATAPFSGGVGTLGTIESFESPATNWPDELY